MGGGGGAEPAGRIGAGGGDRPAEGAKKPRGHGMAGNSDGQGFPGPPRPGARRAARPAGEHEGERPRPKPGGQDPGALVHLDQGLGRRRIANVDDQKDRSWDGLWLRRWPATARPSMALGAEPIDRLGRKSDQAAGGERRGGGGDVLFRRRQDRSRRPAHVQRPRAMKSGWRSPPCHRLSALPSTVTTCPPAAARTAWPAAVSHSMVRPKRG